MVGVAPILFIFWKLVKRTPFKKSSEIDLIWERPMIEAYEATFISAPVGFWTEMLDLVRFKRGSNDERVVDRRNSKDRRGSVKV